MPSVALWQVKLSLYYILLMQTPNPPAAILYLVHPDVLLPGANAQPVPLVPNDDEAAPPPTAAGEYALRGNCVLGRDPSCELRVRSERIDVSRRHATIEPQSDSFVIRDHSRHGTFVNGRRIEAWCRLDSGDTIGLALAVPMLRFQTVVPVAEGALLSAREAEVLQLLAAGYSTKEIAATLMISANTVNTHLKSLYEKLGAHSRVEAVNQARKRGLL